MTLDLARSRYASFIGDIKSARKYFGRPVTFTEKILFSHWLPAERETKQIKRGVTSAKFLPDRVAMQDATAQMAMLQFMSSKRTSTAVPASIHCDHLIQANAGAAVDLTRALKENAEVYDFLASSASKFGIDFWQPGSGIIHQVVLENYAFPGAMMIGTDSHTPNAGGLAMLAIGVGGADAAEVMTGLAWSVTWPRLVGVRLTGALQGWAAPKDIILWLAGKMTVRGGTGKIIEYFGPGISSISCTGRATITNMGAELGATTSVFPYDERSRDYLKSTHRAELASLCENYLSFFRADPEIESEADKYFDEIYELDLSKLEPHIVGPHTPDLARPLSAFAAEVREKGYPEKISAALIGSCTNSSYEDIGSAAAVAEQAISNGVKVGTQFWVTPGSTAVYETVKRDGMLQKLSEVGGTVLANACGPCIGQWKRDDIKPGDTNSIVTSFNRNFRKRNDGNAETLAFIGSPEIVTALAIGGTLTFNPLTDAIKAPDGHEFRLTPPKADDLPKLGFASADGGCIRPAKDPASVTVIVPQNSQRLALLEPFPPWDGKDFCGLPVLVKALGKCTTDHISPAGPWLQYRGNLDRISDNMFSGASNAFSGEIGTGLNVFTGERAPFAKVARDYKAGGARWIAIGDENYGEGSSREHAAMSPRHLGCVAVIAKSFARIAETNLKKQGLLALTFEDPSVYDKIQETDRLDITGLESFQSGEPLWLVIHSAAGGEIRAKLLHSFTNEQIRWFKAGSALNSVHTI